MFFFFILCLYYSISGLREETQDIVEKEGVNRAIKAASSADIIVSVQDVSENVQDEVDLAEYGLEDTGQIKLRLLNKMDLIDPSDNKVIPGFPVSSLTGQGIHEFLEVLTKEVKHLCETQSGQDCPGLTRERHRLHLAQAIEHLNQYLKEESQGSDLVICAHYLRKAARVIGLVSGKVTSEKILDVIFADFCIGK